VKVRGWKGKRRFGEGRRGFVDSGIRRLWACYLTSLALPVCTSAPWKPVAVDAGACRLQFVRLRHSSRCQDSFPREKKTLHSYTPLTMPVRKKAIRAALSDSSGSEPDGKADLTELLSKLRETVSYQILYIISA
jgi:hypothetical protein